MENIVKPDKKPIKNVILYDVIAKRNRKYDDEICWFSVMAETRRTAAHAGRIGRDDANDEGNNEPLNRVYKVGQVNLYTVESILRLLLHSIGSGSGDLEGIRRNVWRPIFAHSDSEGLVFSSSGLFRSSLNINL